jgi:acyl carrier protein
VIEDVKQILKDVLQLGDRVDNFTADTPLLGSVAELDSMAVVGVLTLLEESYDVTIDDDEIGADIFATVGSLSRFLESKVGT